MFDFFSQDRWLIRNTLSQGHTKSASREAENIMVGKEGGCCGEDAACAPDRLDG